MSIKAKDSGLRFLVISLLIVILDQYTKYLVVENIPAYTAGVAVTSFFSLVHVYNEGAAFSFLADMGGWQRYLFMIIASVISLILIVALRRTSRRKPYTTVNRKNHEINGFIRIQQNIELPDDAIFYADALNTRQNFIDFLKERHVDWILAIKGQNATKLMYDAVKERFDLGADVTFKKLLPPQLVSVRIEERTVEAVPVSELGVKRISLLRLL